MYPKNAIVIDFKWLLKQKGWQDKFEEVQIQNSIQNMQDLHYDNSYI